MKILLNLERLLRCYIIIIIIIIIIICTNVPTTITKDLKWNTHISNVCTKANRSRNLGFLRRNLFSCPQDVREAAYKGLVRPILEYGSSVWDPDCEGLIDDLEKVQKRAKGL